MIIADFITLCDGEPCLRRTEKINSDTPETTRRKLMRENAFIDKANENIRAMNYLADSGILERIAKWYHTQVSTDMNGKTVKYIDFVVDTDDIDENTSDFLKEMYPGEYITDMSSETNTTCLYTKCMSLAGNMSAHRKHDGKNCRSWELPIVQMLSSENAYRVYKICKKKGPVASAVSAFRMLYGIA